VRNAVFFLPTYPNPISPPNVKRDKPKLTHTQQLQRRCRHPVSAMTPHPPGQFFPAGGLAMASRCQTPEKYKKNPQERYFQLTRLSAKKSRSENSHVRHKLRSAMGMIGRKRAQCCPRDFIETRIADLDSALGCRPGRSTPHRPHQDEEEPRAQNTRAPG